VTRPRGNRNSGAKIEARRAEVAAAVTGDDQVGIADLAATLGVSRQTLWRDLQAIEARYVEGSKDDVAAFKKSQYDALIRIESATAEGSIEPDVANALVRIRDSVARLLGLNAPEKRITAHVDASTTQVQYRFLEHSHGLTADQIEQVFRFMDALPRRAVSIADCYPGQSGKPVPQLTEGDKE
jgi:hypothetical protein